MITVNYYSNFLPNQKLFSTLKECNFTVRYNAPLGRDILLSNPKPRWFIYNLSKTLDHIYNYHNTVELSELHKWGGRMFLIFPKPEKLLDYPDLIPIFNTVYPTVEDFISKEFSW